ncbi:dihydropyrimidinase [Sporomusaceae bacterium BoRhaA]|uniref:dihydropyrimidinase n=1 Tax=Pelorhabdus rhamnosifermentans TaxID=2772457 RepID=UPI001C062DB4|nr:dihydropyrimidinase [Pelorhabdus rhamnosifermentans]MBU2702662.1 dihydropyrimidinase [Pelorhabdus rhamnosifermentans]
MGIVLQGGTVVTATDCYQGDVRLEGEKIAAIGSQVIQPDDEVISVNGCYLFPGGIDTHTHFDLNTGTTVTADDFSSGTAAAVLGGTTTILDFATQNKGETLQQAVENWQQKAVGKSYSDFGFHMAITDWHEQIEQEMFHLVHDEGISSFKLYLAYKGTLQVDDGVLFAALKRSPQIGALMAFHCENGDVISQLIKEKLAQGLVSPRYHPISHPAAAEQEAVARVLSLAEIARAPAYIVHVSCASALESIAAARNRGVEVYAESCPQYLLLHESCYETDDFTAAKYVMSPPLRLMSDTQALWTGLSRGAINTLGTDHCSFNYAGQKDLGIHDFSKIPNGIPGVENRLGLMYTYGVLTGKITLNQFVALIATNGAKLFGLFPQKGTIAPGSDADIVVWDPTYRGMIRQETLRQRVDYTPYERFAQTGKARHVFLRGRQVVVSGKLQEEPSGRYLFRKPFYSETVKN